MRRSCLPIGPHYCWLAALLLLFPLLGAKPAADADVFVVGTSRQQVLAILKAEAGKPFRYPEFFTRYAQRFAGVPYGAGGRGCAEGQTLVNLEQMDCVTFIENLMALALTARDLAQGGQSLTEAQQFERFVHHLDSIRYYDGVNCTWDDRIHYFSDALRQLQRRNLAIDVGAQVGQPLGRIVSYMSCNPRSYRGIRNWPRIRTQESALTTAQRFFVPISAIRSYEAVAQTGDIVALVTTVEGLDVSHCGFAHWKGKELGFTHASSAKKELVVQQTLCDYLATRTSISGIMVYRPNL